VDDLVVDSELLAIVVDDEDADAASSTVEGLSEAAEQRALVKDRKTLLDITGLGHGDDTAILADVKNTVLLEDRTQHVLDNDGRCRVGDEAGLLMELLGEEVNTEVAVLAGLGGGGDTDDLARAALEDQEIANADVVAGDGDGVGGSHGARSCGVAGGRRVAGSGVASPRDGDTRVDTGRSGGEGRGGGSVLLLDYDFLAVVFVGRAGVGVGVRVVVAVTVDRVEDAVSSFVETVAEGVVVTVFVVISHITLVLFGTVDSGSSSLFYSNVSLGVARVDDVNLTPRGGVGVVLGGVGLLGVAGGLLVVGAGTEVETSSTYDGMSALAELTLRDVDLGRSVVGGRTVDSIEVPVVGLVLDVDLSVDVGVVGLLVAVDGKGKGQLRHERERTGDG
jgi:hypothetical protein